MNIPSILTLKVPTAIQYAHETNRNNYYDFSNFKTFSITDLS